MNAERFDRLPSRVRECLRLYSRGYKLKVIAQTLDLSPNTVGGYLTEAASILGVDGRAAAASALLAYEAAHPDARGRFSAGDDPPVAVPSPVPDSSPPPPPKPWWTSVVPVRTGAHNDLSIAARLLWIIGLAVAGAVAFGALANAAHVISDLAR